MAIKKETMIGLCMCHVAFGSSAKQDYKLIFYEAGRSFHLKREGAHFSAPVHGFSTGIFIDHHDGLMVLDKFCVIQGLKA